ncbi:uncharacterized protein LOC130123028 [Lampris incognitus]|uniref:uncharacterized protein LOC130123028 n=1 Tax=Lampris incognitus TaxID=2546036 RepID=UPI0024B5F607|nr:uncharacterized protein LOC130123028 [Lampris incognitus]
MGQLLSSSSSEELSEARDWVGSLLYDAMMEGGAIPDLRVTHPVLLSRPNEGCDPGARLQEQLQQLQSEMGNRVPTYLRDLIGRFAALSDEPHVTGLVGLVVSMVMDMAYTSSRWSSGATVKSAGSLSSEQRMWELQELMEEYLKRCRINLSNPSHLIQDTARLEAQLSLTLTQLKTSLLGGECNSRCLRQWASGAAFHTHMLLQLAALERQAEPMAARTVLQQYQQDLAQLTPAYRRYKMGTIHVVKCRGGLVGPQALPSEPEEGGAMTGVTVTDRETGRGVAIPLSDMQTVKGRSGGAPDSDNAPGAEYSAAALDLITSDQYAQAYVDHLFSSKGPVAQLENYFTGARDHLSALRLPSGSPDGTGANNGAEGVGKERTTNGGKARDVGERGREAETEGHKQEDENLMLSIAETQPAQSQTPGLQCGHDSHG